MRKPQWRMLITAILETRNDLNEQSAFIENRLEELRARLDEIERRLPPGADMELHTYEILPDGTRRECEG